jgi:hypothetical protein
MSNIGMNRAPRDRKAFVAIALVIIAVIIIAAVLWAPHERGAARNDGRAGTTSETSPKNPTAAPGGGAQTKSQ